MTHISDPGPEGGPLPDLLEAGAVEVAGGGVVAVAVAEEDVGLARFGRQEGSGDEFLDGHALAADDGD